LSVLSKNNGQSRVFLADMKTLTVRLVPVTIGIVSGAMAEIVEPPLSGMVVSVGQHLLEDGSAITLSEDTLSSEVSSVDEPKKGDHP